MVQDLRATLKMLSRRAPALAALACLLVACRSARTVNNVSAISTPTEPAATYEIEATPAWVGMPVSWEKLNAIEAWLGEQPADSHGFWRVEGELQLQQGRLEFARRDATGKATPAAVAQRTQAARAGIARLIADPDATEGQRARARAVLARADKLLDRPNGKTTTASALTSSTIISRATWGAAAGHPERMERNKGGWHRITVHHSAEENAPELDGSIADSSAAIRQMQKSHMEAKSPRWGDIGYHFLIDPAGHVFQGRELTWQGAHAEGDNNYQNIGICLIGNFDEERPTKAALESLRKLIDGLRKQNAIPRSAVFGHQDLKSTRCPGRFLEPWVRDYAH